MDVEQKCFVGYRKMPVSAGHLGEWVGGEFGGLVGGENQLKNIIYN